MTTATHLAATRSLIALQARLVRRSAGAVVMPVIAPVVAALVIAAVPAARRPTPVFGGLSVSQAYTPTLVLFAVTMLALVVMPQQLAEHREGGFLRRLRATPTAPVDVLTALVAVTSLVAGLVAAVVVLGPLAFGVTPPAHPVTFALAVMLALGSFLALGLVLCALIPTGRLAVGVGNVVAALMWFAAGMWYPRAQFPAWLAAVTDALPGGAAAALMLDATAGAPIPWVAVLVCLAWMLAGAVVAAATFRWE